MLRELALAGIAIAMSGCRCGGDTKDRSAQAPPKTAPADAAGTPRIPPATEPDPGYEARRDELLRRGDPAMVKDAPVLGQEETPPEASVSEMIKPVSKDVMLVKAIRVDLAARTLEIPAKVWLEEGILEFIAV